MSHTTTPNLGLVSYEPLDANIPPIMRDISRDNVILDRVIGALQQESADYPGIVQDIATLKDLTAALASTVSAHTAEIAALDPTELRGLRAALDALEQKVDANSENIATFLSRVDGLGVRVDALERALPDIQSDIATIQTVITALNVEVTNNHTEQIAINAEIDARLEKIEAWENRLVILEEEVKNALKDIEINAQNISTNAGTIANHESRIQALENS